MKKKTAIAWSIGILMFGLLMLVLGYQYGADYFAGNSQEWITRSYGEPPMVLTTPAPLRTTDLDREAPADMKKLIKNAQTFMYTPDQGLQLLLNSVEYQKEISINIEGAIDGAIYTLGNQQGVSGLNYEEQPLQINQLSGRRLLGTYDRGGRQYHFSNLIFNSDSHLWQLTIIYPTENQVASEAAEKIIASLQIPSLTNKE
jgi:hypothetical protein